MLPSLRCVSVIIWMRMAIQLHRFDGMSARSRSDSPSRSRSGSGGFPVTSILTQSSSVTSWPSGVPTRISRRMWRIVAYSTLVRRRSSARSSVIFAMELRNDSRGALLGESVSCGPASPQPCRLELPEASNAARSPGLFSRR